MWILLPWRYLLLLSPVVLVVVVVVVVVVVMVVVVIVQVAAVVVVESWPELVNNKLEARTRRPLNTNLEPGQPNTYSGPGLLNTNWGPGPLNTNWGPEPGNTNWGPGKYKAKGRGPGNTNTPFSAIVGKNYDGKRKSLSRNKRWSSCKRTPLSFNKFSEQPFIAHLNATTFESIQRNRDNGKMVEVATRGVLRKKMFSEISQSSQENTCTRVSLLIKLQALGLQLY